MDIYGEKYSGDSKFVADCRQLQSMYRVEVNETIRPYKGRDGKTHYYGNYISDGEKSGNNFLTNYAFRYATERVTNKKEYETIEQDRLFNNLLSSQPMAFNLFCPLREMLEKSPEAATAEMYFYMAPNFTSGAENATRLNIGDKQVILSNGAPDSPDRDYNLYHNSNYTFTINLK